MDLINVIMNDGSEHFFEVLPDVPVVGGSFKGSAVQQVAPFFPERPQTNPDVYNYALWRVRVQYNGIPYLVAVHEPESDTM